MFHIQEKHFLHVAVPDVTTAWNPRREAHSMANHSLTVQKMPWTTTDEFNVVHQDTTDEFSHHSQDIY